jgi:phosphoribosyl 1,2-cyclic phosphodiesterase
MGFGGNTACLEVRLPSGEIAVIDGGTGIRSLGASLMHEASEKSLDLHLFLSHFHWDHIQGIPLFEPLIAPRNTVTFYAMTPAVITAEVLERQMSAPYYPVGFSSLTAKRTFIELFEREICLGETRISGFSLNHPQGCQGYRLRHGSSTLVYASDHEHGDPRSDRLLLEAADGADTLVFDAQYTPSEYDTRRGWGHSSWLDATRVARQAGVRRLILFHHDPTHDDTGMRQILLEARQEFSETSIATEGEDIFVG